MSPEEAESVVPGQEVWFVGPVGWSPVEDHLPQPRRHTVKEVIRCPDTQKVKRIHTVGFYAIDQLYLTPEEAYARLAELISEILVKKRREVSIYEDLLKDYKALSQGNLPTLEKEDRS